MAMKLVYLFLIIMISLQLTSFVQTSQDTNKDENLRELENFLISQFNSEAGLIRESPDSTINQTYWLMGDNYLAYHALNYTHPEIANKIYQTMLKYQNIHHFQDGLHEAIMKDIQFPPYTPEKIIVENNSKYTIMTEVRNINEDAKIMDDWDEYADILLYASLSFNNQGNREKARFYFNRAANMWNEAGIADKPTDQDGFYSTYKLGLMLYASHVLNIAIPFRADLESKIWLFQRARDGGIRTHYLGNITSDREANSETAAIILLAYNYEKVKLEKITAKRAQQEAEKTKLLAEEQKKQRFAYAIAIVFIANILVLIIVLFKKRNIIRYFLSNRRKQNRYTKSDNQYF